MDGRRFSKSPRGLERVGQKTMLVWSTRGQKYSKAGPYGLWMTPDNKTSESLKLHQAYFYEYWKNVFTIWLNIRATLAQISLLRAVSVCNKTTFKSKGSVGGAGELSHSCTLGTFLFCPLALSMPTYSNF